MNKKVSYQQAKLLKEKGFDENCESWAYLDDNCMSMTYDSKTCVKVPTIADVVTWLYEKHGIYIHISPHGDDETLFKNCKWWFSIYKDKAYNLLGGSKVTKGIDDFNSIKEAYEAAIDYCLNHIV